MKPKVLLHYPKWSNRWEPYVIDALSEFDLTITHSEDAQELGDLSINSDILVSMWANRVTEFWTHEFPEKKIVTYLRRYEIWEPRLLLGINWPVVDKTIFVSEWCRRAAFMMLKDKKMKLPGDTRVIPNGINFDEFPFRSVKPGTKKIALVCSMKEVKNVPLALQILLELPEEYTLHHIGLPFSSRETGQIFSYMHGLGLTDRFHTDWNIPRERVADWLMDKDFILSTSLNEGNPNNIIEAMAMGIKPIIHSWPGAKDQFPDQLIFNRIGEAVNIIKSGDHNPWFYRDWVESRYSVDNFKQLTATIKELV